MSSFGEFCAITVRAASDLRRCQYHIMRYTAANEVNIASHAAATALLGPVGVLQTNPNSGQSGALAVSGEVKVIAGGSVSVNVLITNNSSGRATAAVSGDLVIGRALEAAGADGDHIRCLIHPALPLLRT